MMFRICLSFYSFMLLFFLDKAKDVTRASLMVSASSQLACTVCLVQYTVSNVINNHAMNLRLPYTSVYSLMHLCQQMSQSRSCPVFRDIRYIRLIYALKMSALASTIWFCFPVRYKCDGNDWNYVLCVTPSTCRDDIVLCAYPAWYAIKYKHPLPPITVMEKQTYHFLAPPKVTHI